MGDIERMKAILDAIGYEDKRCQCLDLERGRNPFITISRESGAGGHTLAAAVLEAMKREKGNALLEGWQVCDQELCRMVAEEPGLAVSMKSLLGKEYQSQIEDMFKQLIAHTSPQDQVIKKMFTTVRALAVHGKVIFIGRGAACLTRNLPLGIHLRLVASKTTRVRRMARHLGLTEKEAGRFVDEQDRSRAKLVQTFFNKDIADPLLYDAVWNTDTIPAAEIASAVLELVKLKSCHCENARVFAAKP